MTSKVVQTPTQMKTLPSRGLKSSPPLWMQEKAKRDQELWDTPSGQYWIVQNKMYDLTKFIDKHPGGQSWIRLTKGQDITEHFIIHHLREQKARQILKKYEIGDCPKKVIRYSFKEDGFYRTVKRRVLDKYNIDDIQNENVSKINGIIILTVWLLCIISAVYRQSIFLSLLCGPLMMGLVGIGHNFVHHKQSVFRYFLLLAGFTHRQWQIMHCISHHVYPNTELDFQNAAFQPIGYYLRSMPQNKRINQLVLQLAFFLLQPLNMLLKILILPILRGATPDLLYSFPLIWLFFGAYVHNSFWIGLKMYLIIYCFFSFIMMKALFCGHRIQDTWTQGEQKNEDFGEHTIYSTSDTDSWLRGIPSFILVVGFNIHVAHHLFPTADHHFLPKINEEVKQLCLQRGIKRNQKSRIQCLKSIYKGFMNREPFSKK